MERIEKYGVMLALVAQVLAIVWWSATLAYRVDLQEETEREHGMTIKEIDRKVIILETQLAVIEKQLELQRISLEQIHASIKK